jgi:cysteine-rich repeat protein
MSTLRLLASLTAITASLGALACGGDAKKDRSTDETGGAAGSPTTGGYTSTGGNNSSGGNNAAGGNNATGGTVGGSDSGGSGGGAGGAAGTPTSGGSAGTPTSGGSAGTPALGGTAGTPTSGGSAGTSAGAAPTGGGSPTGGATGTGGAVSTGGATPAGGDGGAAGTNPGGAGGSAGTPGEAGRGGAGGATQEYCGDGIVNGSEECDDGNTGAGDGCSATCTIEPGHVWESEDNDVWTRADPVGDQPVTIHGSIDPLGDYDWFSFELTGTADLTLSIFDPGTEPTCDDVYLMVELHDANGVPDDRIDLAIGDCELLTWTWDESVRQMPPGTYYVLVRHNANNAVVDGYRLQIDFDALCGDGAVSGNEECDDGNTGAGDGCDDLCQREPECGDGHVDYPESCDDGNTDPNDACSDTCIPTYIDEELYEPNDTGADADTNASTPPGSLPPLLIDDTVMIGGSLDLGDTIPDANDFFKLHPATDSFLYFHMTTNDRATDCTLGTGVEAALWLYTDPTDFGNYFDYDVGSGDSSRCVRHPVFLGGGQDYYARVFDYGANDTIANYRLAVDVLSPVVTETEPNNADFYGTWNPNDMTGYSNFVIQGRIEDGDWDIFAVTIPPGHALFAQVFGAGTDRCQNWDDPAGTIDSYINVWSDTSPWAIDSNADRKWDYSDFPDNYCSAIDDLRNESSLPVQWYIEVGEDYYSAPWDYHLSVVTKPF